MDQWLKKLPKAELHLHIEGTLEPEQMFELAARNGVPLAYRNVAEVRAAYQFDDLQSFLNLYHQGMTVLRTEEDFYDLALAYFRRAHADGVVHADVSFDSQGHLARGIELGVPFQGLTRAMHDAQHELGISSALIMSFLRDESAQDALAVFERAEPWYDQLAAIGLDNAERGNPPGKFRAVFERAKAVGLARTAHAGEEGPPSYITEALDILDVNRIDHGVRCVEDPDLLRRLHDTQMPLTVCPLSNVNLHVVDSLADHPLPQMLEAGLNVSLNSDDPAYLGGGMLTNFRACAHVFGWDQSAFRRLAANSINAAFMPDERRQRVLAELSGY